MWINAGDDECRFQARIVRAHVFLQAKDSVRAENLFAYPIPLPAAAGRFIRGRRRRFGRRLYRRRWRGRRCRNAIRMHPVHALGVVRIDSRRADPVQAAALVETVDLLLSGRPLDAATRLPKLVPPSRKFRFPSPGPCQGDLSQPGASHCLSLRVPAVSSVSGRAPGSPEPESALRSRGWCPRASGGSPTGRPRRGRRPSPQRGSRASTS